MSRGWTSVGIVALVAVGILAIAGLLFFALVVIALLMSPTDVRPGEPAVSTAARSSPASLSPPASVPTVGTATATSALATPAPTASSDGERIVFTSVEPSVPGKPGSANLWLIAPDGSNPTLLPADAHKRLWPDGGSSAPGYAPSWAIDGRRLLIAVDYRLWEVEVPGGQTRLVYESKEMPPLSVFNPRYSPDGSRIAFLEGCCSARTVVVMKADGTDRKQLTDRGVFSFEDWHPDGGRILYGQAGPGREMIESYWLMDLETGKSVKLVDEKLPGFVHSARISPDGKRVAVEYVPKDSIDAHSGVGRQHIAVLDAERGGLIILTKEFAHGATSPAWSPDGKRIVFVADSGKQYPLGRDHDIWVMNADGSHRLNLTQGRFSDAVAPSWGRIR